MSAIRALEITEDSAAARCLPIARSGMTAEDAATKPDVPEAFRARCRSLLFLAEAFHKARHKQESFRPNWTPPPGSE